MDGSLIFVPPVEDLYMSLRQNHLDLDYTFITAMFLIAEHINRGLYGAFIIDPKIPRPPAKEMVMVLNGYDTDFDKENNFYTVNGIPFYYIHNPIEIKASMLGFIL